MAARHKPATLRRIATMASSGVSPRDIAKKIGATSSAVSSLITRHDLPRPTEDFLGAPVIAAGMGVGPNVVRKWIRYGWLFGPHRPDPPKIGFRWRLTEDHVLDFIANPAYWIEWSVDRVADRTWRSWAADCRKGEQKRFTVTDFSEIFMLSYAGIEYVLGVAAIRPAQVSARGWKFYGESEYSQLRRYLLDRS